MNKRARTRLIVVTVIILAVFGVLLARVALSGGLQYYKTVAQLKAQQAQLVGKDIQVMGRVQAKTVQRGPAGLRFEITNNGRDTIPILFSGSPPATFKEGADVIVNGTLTADGIVTSKSMITKCPTKFQAEQDKAVKAGK